MAKAAPSPLGAELLGVPKGAAAPASESLASESLASVAGSPVAEISGSPGRRPPDATPPPPEEARTALTVRLPVSTQERLREAAHRTRQEKQIIVDQAIQAWLNERGY